MPRSVFAAVVSWLRTLRYSYLFLPGLISLAFAALAFVLLALDRAAGPTGVGDLFPAGAPAARAILTTIAGSLATVVGVAFSVTIVTLQLVSQQFTPRALRGFLGDRVIQTVAGVFVGVIVYCLVTLRAIEEGEEAFVAGLTVTVAFFLAIVALGMLLVFIHHVAQSIQASEITRGIADATVDAIERLEGGGNEHESELEGPDELVTRWHLEAVPTSVYPEHAGYVQGIDDMPATIEGDSFRIELLVAPGDFVTRRHPLARVWTNADAETCAAAVRRTIKVAAERDLTQDVGYGIRQLSDIAIRALSPSVNDPTTAATAIGYLQEVFEQLAQRPWPSRVCRVEERNATVILRHDTFSELLEALVQIGRYADDARIVERLARACIRIRDAARDAREAERAGAAAHCGARITRRALDGGTLDAIECASIAALEADLRR